LAGLHPVVPPNRILRTVFAVDRAFAASSALLLIAAGPILANVLDWPAWVVVAIGAALAPYALLLHRIHRSGALRSALARLTAAGDLGWVVGSIVLLIGWPGATGTAGKWLVAVIAVAVADIGLVKLYGWRRPDRP
jgi:hypothetical protein